MIHSSEGQNVPPTDMEISHSKEFKDYGENDYRQVLIEVALGKGSPDREGVARLQKFETFEIVYSPDLSMQHQIKEPRYSEPTEYDDPWFIGYDYPDITIDPDIVSIVVDHKDALSKTFPKLVEFVDYIVSREEDLNTYMHHNDLKTLLADHVLGLVHVDPSELRKSESAVIWNELVEMSYGQVPIALKEFFERDTVTLDMITNLWPVSLQQDISSNISVIEQFLLFAHLNFGVNVALERHLDFSQAPFEVSIGLQYLKMPDLDSKTGTFLLEHPELLEDSYLNAIAKVAKVEFTQEEKDAIFFSTLHEAAHIPFLIDRGKYPVAVLEFYKDYESCDETEGKLNSELKEDKALLLRLNFKDEDTSVLFGVKFGEITLLAALSSNDPRFQEGMSYLPIDETYKNIRDIRWAEELTYDQVTLPKKMYPLIFAKNRLLNYSDDEFDAIKTMALEKEKMAA